MYPARHEPKSAFFTICYCYYHNHHHCRWCECCREAQEELIERVKQAAALPVVISIKDVYDETCTELLVLANLDSGARGRPRVTYDVTAALNAMQLCVFMADVYIESPLGDVEQRPQELHRFLVHCVDGCRLSSAGEKR